MDPQSWNDFIQTHKGIAGSVIIRTPAEENGTAEMSKNPPILVNFKDGTSLKAIFNGDGSINITDPGTAYKPGPHPKVVVSGASTSDRKIAVQDPTTGEITWEDNKNYVAPKEPVESSPTTYKDPTTGVAYQWDTAKQAWITAPGLPASPPTAPSPDIRSFPDGSLRERDPKTDTWKVIADPPAAKPDTSPTTYKDPKTGQVYQWDATKGQWGPAPGLPSASAATPLGAEARTANAALVRQGYQQQIATLREKYLNGDIPLDQFQAQATDLHQQATEDLTAATSAATTQSNALRDWENNSVPAGGNAAMVQVLNAEGAPAGIKLPAPTPTPYPRPDIESMIQSSLSRLQASAPFNTSQFAPPGAGNSGSGSAAPAAPPPPPQGFSVPEGASSSFSVPAGPVPPPQGVVTAPRFGS